jgi:hypothetical protein
MIPNKSALGSKALRQGASDASAWRTHGAKDDIYPVG